jgi:hypothetical protein
VRPVAASAASRVASIDAVAILIVAGDAVANFHYWLPLWIKCRIKAARPRRRRPLSRQ